jgi:hypothetical protein
MSEGQKRRFKTHKHPLNGTKTPKEIVEKHRTGILRYYQNHNAPNKGVPHTLETRSKISQSMKKHWNSKKGLQRRLERSRAMKEDWQRKKQHYNENSV